MTATTSAALELLAELVSIPSHVSQPEGVAAVGARVGVELGRLGFERAPPPSMPPERRAPLWAEQILCPEAGFDQLLEPIVWRRSGAAVGTLLILGDLDAALALDSDACRLAIRAGRATGPAVADMKGGLVVLIEALRSATTRGRPLPSITVVLSADEQAGSLRSASVIATEAQRAAWCICVECARDGGRLMRSRGHIGVGLLRAIGRESHAGSARGEGVNAITALARGIGALDAPGVSTLDATVTATMLQGGRRRSIVPASASAVLDVRARDATAWTSLHERILAAISTVDSASQLQLDLFSHRPGLRATTLTEWLLTLIARAGEEVGVQIEATDSLAAGSSAFVDSSRIPVLDGMGPSGGDLMTPGEYVEVESIASRSAVLALAIEYLGTSG